MPSPTKNMLPIRFQVNVSTPNRQLTTKTDTGEEACTDARENQAWSAAAQLAPVYLLIQTSDVAHLEHLNERDAEEEVRRIAGPQNKCVQPGNWCNHPGQRMDRVSVGDWQQHQPSCRLRSSIQLITGC